MCFEHKQPSLEDFYTVPAFIKAPVILGPCGHQ